MTTALALAALAVVWISYSRAHAPAGLPPLSPIADPSGRPLPPPNVRFRGGQDPYQQANSGPHPLTLLAILAAGAMIAFSIRENGTPAPSPAPAPVVGLDLRGRFVGPDAAADAGLTAALLEELHAGRCEAVHRTRAGRWVRFEPGSTAAAAREAAEA